MQKNNIHNGKIIFENNSVKGTLLQKTESCEFIYLTIEPKSEIKKHSLDILVNFYVITGNGIIEFDNNQVNVSAGDIISVPPGKMREWKNTGDTQLQILVVKEISTRKPDICARKYQTEKTG